MQWIKQSIIDQLPGAPGAGRVGRLPRLLIVVGLVAVVTWAARARRQTPAESNIEPVAFVPRSTGWRGTWLAEDGPAMIRFDGAGSIFSPDGMALLTIRPTMRGDEAAFRVWLKGYPWMLRLVRSGDTAQLTGVREMQPATLPVVVAGGSAADQRRRADARSMMLPEDFGKFVKSDGSAAARPAMLPAGNGLRREEK